MSPTATDVVDLTAPRICARTGLALRPATGATIWRIAKTSFGALNPEKRKTGSNPETWGRYDVRQHRTIYGASPIETAYGESLAWARMKLTLDQPQLRELFDDVDPGDTTSLLEQVQQDWEALGHMPPGNVPAGWRFERLLHEVYLPKTGWFVDIEASQSVAAIASGMGSSLGALSVDHLTVGHLRGEDRGLTTAIAEWVWHRVLDDGSLPLGTQFGSKHGSDWSCWAAWLRAVDDGNPDGELTTADTGTEIQDPEHNPPLQHICDLFNIKVH